MEAFLSERSHYEAFDSPGPISLESFLSHAALADGVITSSVAIHDQVLSALPHLRCVSTSSVGYDHFDTESMRRHGVIGTHTPGVLDETVADLTFALILTAARRIVELDAVVRSGRWSEQSESDLFGIDVHHRTLGIVGMGRIGAAVARRATQGFGMNVVYHNRSRNLSVERDYDAVYQSFSDVLSGSDFVVLLTPLTPQTVGLMNRAAFALMKPSSVFINVSRGATVDEMALYEALVEKKIRAAGLDVFAQEPTSADNPLLQLRNVVVVPHIGSATRATRDEMAMLAATNLLAVLEGRIDEARIVPELQ